MRLPTPILCIALAAGCATAPQRLLLREADYPGVLRAPAALPFDVVWQQRVTASWGEGRQRGFDAAVQKQGDALTVVGLSPMGSVGFSIAMRGGDVDVQNHTGEELPFPARFVLLDVQRAFFPWLDGAAVGGVRSGEVDGEQVRESYEHGRLARRTFARPGQEGEIVVTYQWGRPDWRGPTRVELGNAWFGYSLRVDTHAETLLPAEMSDR